MTFVNEKEAEKLAKEGLEKYVNACRPQSRTDAILAIQKMIGVAVHALNLVQTGRMDTIQ